MKGNVSAEDWAQLRFDWYAQRIRKFAYGRDSDHVDIATHVYFYIVQLRSTPLLPSLRYLHCPSIIRNNFLISGGLLEKMDELAGQMGGMDMALNFLANQLGGPQLLHTCGYLFLE